jgi:hypothetical protein
MRKKIHLYYFHLCIIEPRDVVEQYNYFAQLLSYTIQFPFSDKRVSGFTVM